MLERNDDRRVKTLELTKVLMNAVGVKDRLALPSLGTAVVLAVTLSSLLLAGPLAARMYRWVDDEGNVVYSQLPPPDQRETREIAPPPPPAESPEEVRQRLQQRLQALEDRNEDQALAREGRAKEAEKRTASRENCQRARDNLSKLSVGGRRAFRTADGEIKRFDADQQAAQVKQAREAVDKYCK